jgi:hypothetical protein
MAVDFRKPACVTVTSEAVFGICDDAPPSVDPSYLSFENAKEWIAWVDNDQNKDVTFTAIDHCVEILRPNGDQESSCDGMLNYDRTVKFIELKDRDSGRWLGKGIDQLKMTIKIYKDDVGLAAFDRYFAYVANKQRPYFKAASTTLSQKFEDETGFVFIVEHVIKID